MPRAGTCAILGLPNAGKSTLMNRLLDMRLCAVSPRPQTTRNRVLGVKNASLAGDPAQIVFLDTPGAQRGENALRRYMRDQTLSAAGDSDVALLLIDAAEPQQSAPDRLSEGDRLAIEEILAAVKAPVLLALNKVDRVAKPALLPMLEAWSARGGFEELVPISALSGDGVNRLEQAIAARLPEGPALFPEDMVTDRAERFLAGELVREQLFRQLGEELPYATAVVIDQFSERPEKGDVVISASIFVERESQKGIVVGKGGQRIKAIGEAGRGAISQLLGCPVHLLLHVKVAPNWSRDGGGIRSMGYD
ncbi:MAG TPA: GTPase Era [Kofleriaceae bacterium]|jgi:GTP-binding protein Era